MAPATETSAQDDTTTGAKTPEQLAAEKATADAAAKATADAAAAAKATADAEAARKAADLAKPPDVYALTVPQNSPFDTNDLAVFAATAKTLALSNDAAQSLVNARAQEVRTITEQYLADVRADPELGGARFETSITHARAGIEAIFGKKGTPAGDLARELFDKTGLGNHKELIRRFAHFGRGLAEDKPITPGRETGRNAGKTAAEILYGSNT